MNERVIGGRGHKISPITKGTSKIAYNVGSCPKIDTNDPDNYLSFGTFLPSNGNLFLRLLFIASNTILSVPNQ
ncbi:CLUMA_CG017655, isoform A [Clunio marinus]|uniref:CLUMA_CG017655, isoform A n=1 Tax=Clunio marinus TaxID=568069 RepID=A0A1J1IWD2_9DIPT|nr:CLUMA_CG017655, isoform A [Clunio marinus]